MKTEGFSGGLYRPLTEEQVRTVHEASLHILEGTGFTFEPGLEDTLEMLEEGGIRVDRERSLQDPHIVEAGRSPCEGGLLRHIW
ncbi:MAG: hypothetical protein WAL98_03220 [Desulfatiglandaceae bacterium]|jgi:trimethylamine---corrinoid protein Co-methyltransferase